MSDSVRPHRRQPTRLPRPWDSPGKNTGVGCHFLLQCYICIKYFLLNKELTILVHRVLHPFPASPQPPPAYIMMPKLFRMAFRSLSSDLSLISCCSHPCKSYSVYTFHCCTNTFCLLPLCSLTWLCLHLRCILLPFPYGSFHPRL